MKRLFTTFLLIANLLPAAFLTAQVKPVTTIIGNPPSTTTQIQKLKRGKKHYQLDNHLDNVLQSVSDRKLPYGIGGSGIVMGYRADIISMQDYYAFGMKQVDREMRRQTYRYGFNGQEADDETNGSGNSYDFGERIYDSRLGKFVSADPLAPSFPWWSPYIFAGNTPIQAIDLDGLEIFYSQAGEVVGTYGTNTDVMVINADDLARAQTEFEAYNTARTNNPNATNQYISQTLVTTGSVTFANYFTTEADVTDNAALETYTNNNRNCYTACVSQLANENVRQTGPANGINTIVDNTAGRNTQGNNDAGLTADPHGGAIFIQTQLNNGDPVMVGVEEARTNGNASPNPGNVNALTGHFVVIRSSTVTNGVVTFNYLDNASTALGRNANNNFTLDNTTGELEDNTITQRGAYNNYQVTEVRTTEDIPEDER